MAMTLAKLFFVSLSIWGPGAKFLVLAFQIGDEPVVSYDLLQLLLILGISIVAAVILERLLWRGTPGGLLGAFLIALIGIGLFLALIPLVWKGDYYHRWHSPDDGHYRPDLLAVGGAFVVRRVLAPRWTRRRYVSRA
jgi:hypothetical protein